MTIKDLEIQSKLFAKIAENYRKSVALFCGLEEQLQKCADATKINANAIVKNIVESISIK